MQNHRTRPNLCAIPDGDFSDDHRVAADFHIISYGGHVIGLTAIADGGAVAQGAIFADDGFFVNDQSGSMVEAQAWANGGFVVEFNPELPDDDQLVKRKVWPTQPTEGGWQAVAGLCRAEHGQNELASQVATVGFPILKDSRAHLRWPEMEVSFFMPDQYLPEMARREAWKSGAPIRLEQSGKAACVQCWIYQTWVHLTKAGFPAKLVHKMPEEGIVVALTGNLHPEFRPAEEVFLLGVVADGLPHPAANIQILQNAAHAKRLPGSVYIPLWTQPNILARDPSRGDLFEEVRFFGDEPNLCAELRDASFRSALERDVGVTLVTTPADAWHDYRSTDCAFGIRSFDGKRHDHKPATKLANAWLAGVPFLGGSDSAYFSEGRDGGNYLACRTKHEFVQHLKRLKTDGDFRKSLVEAGTREAARHTPEAHTKLWISLLGDVAAERRKLWQKKSAGSRRAEIFWRSLRLMVDRWRMN